MDRVEATPGSGALRGLRETRVSTAECQTSVRRACIQCARARAITADALSSASAAARESEI